MSDGKPLQGFCKGNDMYYSLSTLFCGANRYQGANVKDQRAQ